MATKYRTKALVFKKEDRNDSDRVFSVFTDDFGRLEVFAKAIRKSNSKLRAGIDVFSLSEIEFIQGRNKKTLTDASLIERFSGVSSNLSKFNIASKIGYFLDSFLKGQEPDDKIFDLIIETMHRLNDCRYGAEKETILKYYFLWNSLSLLGYHPEVYNCGSCRLRLSPEALYFSTKAGGIVCGSCAVSDKNSKEINENTVKILRIILKRDWPTLHKLQIDKVNYEIFQDISEFAILNFNPSNY